MSFYVKGLPKQECKTHDVYHLFGTVAQIKRVHLWNDQGIAEVTLFDKTSVDIVLDQDWALNGSKLILEHPKDVHGRVRHASEITSNCSQDSVIHNTSIASSVEVFAENCPALSPYKRYKTSASTFWGDIPHSAASMVVHGKHKRKRMKWIIDKNKNKDVPFLKHSQKKRSKKGNKNALQMKAIDLIRGENSDFDLENLSCTMTSEKKITEKNSKKSKISSKSSKDKKLNLSYQSDNLLCIDKSDYYSDQIFHVYGGKNTQEEFCDEGRLPVYICFRGSTYLIYIISNAIQHIKNEILRLEKIPKRLQMIIHKGKIIEDCGEVALEAYDTLQVLVRGIGGMQEGSHNQISPSSSEEEIMNWLQAYVGVEKDILQKYEGLQFLDGSTLFSLDIKTFISDVEIPLGLARRIWAMKDPNFMLNENQLSRYTPQDVSGFVQGIFGEKKLDSVKKICDALLQECIDGVALLSYNNVDEFFSDFEGLKIQKIIFRRIISERDKICQPSLVSPCQVSDEASKGAFAASCSVEESETKSQSVDSDYQAPKPKSFGNSDILITNSVTTPYSSNNDVSNEEFKQTTEVDARQVQIKDANFTPQIDQTHAEFIDMLEKRLNLIRCEAKNTFKLCKLRLIHGGWSRVNELEKLFVFFYLCCEDAYENKSTVNGLWNQIRRSTKQWVNKLPPEQRSYFTETHREDTFLYNNKPVQFENQCKSCQVMDKSLDKILQFNNCILLISKTLLQSECDGFKTKLNSNPKSPAIFHFKFISDRNYYIFDPGEYSGFQNCPIPHVFCSSSCKKEEFGVQVSSSVVLDKSEKFPSLQDQGNLAQIESSDHSCIKEEASIIESVYYSSEVGNSQPQVQNSRPFQGTSGHILYKEGNIFSQPESDGTLQERCCEFKLFITSLNRKKETPLIKLQKDALRFACGCLNARKNGTIYFGIADNVQPVEGRKYKHGEIVGFCISEIENECRSRYTDALREGITRCFSPEVVPAAEKCIGNPVFVEVVKRGSGDPKFVMEVDVNPSSNVCGDHFFKLNLSKIKGNITKDCPDKHMLYLREGSATKSLSGDKAHLFMRHELKEYIQERKRFEEQSRPKMHRFLSDSPYEKLHSLMLKGRVKFDKSIWPILILSKPTEDQKKQKDWMTNLSFIKSMQFVAVFDFDNFSNVNGLCKLYRNEETSVLQSEKLFLQNSNNIQQLASDLSLPYEKTLWIYSNGRHDLVEPKPHLTRQEWHMQYSAGVCQAVSFFSHNFVIPTGRALIIILLFSTEFEGLLDTFNEITRNFGWPPVVIIAEQKDIYKSFVDCVQRECKGTQQQLNSVSVTGIEWSHVNSAICDLTGHDEFTNCVIPSSSGTLIPLDERTMESLSDLTILSAKQCETKTFATMKAKKEFNRDQEIQFYKGNKVTWWNFYFETHVLKRYGFDKIKEKLNKILMYPEKDTKKIITISIVHEPGAGGTTLGYNLLWDFRKKARCAVINRITERTMYQVKSIIRYRESGIENLKPVILLIDDVLHIEFSHEEFIRQLNIELRKSPTVDGLNCCILLCRREEKIPFLSEKESLAVNLKQDLIKYEKEWLELKYQELEQIGNDLGMDDYKPEHLISFMIMREGFNPEFIKNTIHHFIGGIDIDSSEFLLLKYVSLISAYTPSSWRKGIKVFVPIECCDDLMRRHYKKKGTNSDWWEQCLSSTLRILLVIEQKESASGQQIRMAHASLAKAVLVEMIQKEESTLSKTALQYLESPLLDSNTHGRKVLVEFTCEMLKRRMKEEYDDTVTTSFSPLIEDIIAEDNYQIAGQVLERGFQNFKDHLVAQTMARLYCKTKEHEKAMKWAREAIDLSPKHSRSFCLHTLGYVLREKFKHQTGKNMFSTKEAVTHLQLILQSLETFLEAQKDRDIDMDNLHPYHDTILTINKITKFILGNVIFTSPVNIKRYLTEKSYIPEELSDLWRDFHHKLKAMHQCGEIAFEMFQKYICFSATFYADIVSYSSSKMNHEHRLYRNMQFQFPSLFNEFAEVFGENAESDQYSQNTELQDSWHRRRLLSLHGNSYMNIFNHFVKMKKPDEYFNENNAKKMFSEIQYHLQKINTKYPRDLANLVCVNVALGLVGGSNRSSESEIIKMCRQIISTKKEHVDLAYFFISILMWPIKGMKVEYDDELFHKSLKYLNENTKQKPPKQKLHRHGFFLFKEEKNIFQPTTQFFLGKKSGVKTLCHRTQIFFKENPDSQYDDKHWEKPSTKDKLRSLDGHLVTGPSSICIMVHNEQFGKPIEIHRVRSGKKEFRSEESVSFYLGFSMAGPIAYNIKPKRHESETYEACAYPKQENPRVDIYLQKSTEELRKCLKEIALSKTKSKMYLKERQKQLLKDENDIITALDILEERDFSIIDD